MGKQRNTPYTQDEIVELVDMLNPNFSMQGEYLNRKEQCIFICKVCGAQKNVSFRSFSKNPTCDNCKKIRQTKEKIESIKTEFNKLNKCSNIINISKEGTTYRVYALCESTGYRWDDLWSSIISRKREYCASCNNRPRIDYTCAYNFYKLKGYQLLENEYKNNNTKMKCMDSENYLYDVSLNKIQNRNPSKFHKNNPYVIHNINNFLNINNRQLEIYSKKYTGSSHKHEWLCKKCNKIFPLDWDNIKQGKGCSRCNKSKLENEVSDILHKYEINFKPQKTFDGLTGLGGGLLSYDFFIEDGGILIECQGETHDTPTRFGNISMDRANKNLKRQIEHDNRKRKYAKNNGYKLIEIWYYEKTNIEDIILEKI